MIICYVRSNQLLYYSFHERLDIYIFPNPVLKWKSKEQAYVQVTEFIRGINILYYTLEQHCFLLFFMEGPNLIDTEV